MKTIRLQSYNKELISYFDQEVPRLSDPMLKACEFLIDIVKRFFEDFFPNLMADANFLYFI